MDLLTPLRSQSISDGEFACDTLCIPLYKERRDANVPPRRAIYAISSVIVGVQALAMLFIKESRPKRIPEAPDTLPRTATGRPIPVRATSSRLALKAFAEQSLNTPVRLFFTEPLVFAITLMSASVFSLLYLFSEALIVVYTDFGFSHEKIAYINILMAIGPFFPIFVRVRDIMVARKLKAQGKQLVSGVPALSLKLTRPLTAQHRSLKTNFWASS